MATNIASLAVSLVAHTAVFRRKMSKATGTVTKFGRLAKAAGAKAIKFAKAITAIGVAAAAAAVGGLALLTRQGMSNLDAMGKVSAKLGISTKALGRLQLAASEAAVTNQQLELGLQRMTRRVAEAAAGTGEAQKALEELGLDAEKLVKLSPDKIFFRLGKALRQAGTQSDKIRLAFKLFDSEGVNLIRILQKSDEELANVSAAADKLGLVFDNISVKMVENAKDATGRVKKMFEGVGNALAEKFAPIIDDLATRLFNVGTEGEGIREKVGDAFDFVIEKADTLILKLDTLIQKLKKLSEGFDTIGAFSSLLDKWEKGKPGGFESGIAKIIKDFFPSLRGRGQEFEFRKARKPKPLFGEGLKGPIRKFIDDVEEKARAKAAVQVAQQAAIGTGIEKAIEKEEEKSRAREVRPALSRIMELRGGVGQGKLGRTFFGDRGDRHQRRQIQLLEEIANNTRTPVAVAG